MIFARIRHGAALLIVSGLALWTPAAAAPPNADSLLSQALEYCRRVGAGESYVAVVKAAQRAGWQRINRDTTGLHTYETVDNQVEWRLPSKDDRYGGRRITLNFYDNPTENGWRGVCGIEVHGESERFYRQFLRVQRFARRLKPAAPDQNLKRAQVEALPIADRVEWFGDRQWRLEFARYGGADYAYAGLTYYVASGPEQAATSK